MEEDPAKHLRSCLRKLPRVNEPDLQTSAQKSVKFNIQEEQLKWIYENDKNAKLASRRWKNKPFSSNNSRFNYALRSLGDVTKNEYFNALRALQNKRILINLQFSVTKEHIEYFWTIKWNHDELTDEEIELQKYRNQFEVLFADTMITDKYQNPRLIVLFVTSGTNALPKIDQSSEHDKLMIVGHLSLIDGLSHDELNSFHFVNLTLTAYDIIRPGPYHSDFVEEVLEACHGWPILAQKFLECERKQHEWTIEAEADLYPYKSSKVIEDLYILLKICELTRQDVTMISFMNIGFTEWAKICGAIVIRREMHEFVALPEIGPELMAQMGLESTEFDQRVAASTSPNDLLIFFPSQFSKAMDEDFALLDAAENPNGSFAWLAMQQIINKNITDDKNSTRTFSEKFSFMKHTLVSDLRNSSNALDTLSLVEINPKSYKSLKHRPRDYVFNFDLINAWYFPAVIWEMPIKTVFNSLHGSASPDWFIKLKSPEDPTTQHLLCLFLEVDEDLSLQQLVDKLWQKCPYLIVAYYCRITNETRLEFNNKDGAISLKMTAIVGSIRHTKLKHELQERTNVHSVNGAMRCTNKELAFLPNDFELIVLLDEGLNELLGSHVYNTLKNFNPMYLNN